MKSPGASDPNTGPLKDVFRHKLENLKAAPGEQLWERLELDLDRQQVSRDKDRVRTFLRLAAVLLLLLLSVGGILTYQYLKPLTGLVAVRTTEQAAPKQSTSKSENQAKANAKPSQDADPKAQEPGTVETQQPEDQNNASQAHQEETKETVETSSPGRAKELAITAPDQPISTSLAVDAPSRSKANTREKPAKAAISQEIASSTRSGNTPGQSKSSVKEKVKSEANSAGIALAIQVPGNTSETVTTPQASRSEIASDTALHKSAQAKNIPADVNSDSITVSKAVSDTVAATGQEVLTLKTEPAPEFVQKDSSVTLPSLGWSVSALAGPALFYQNIRLTQPTALITPNATALSVAPLYEEAAREFDANTRAVTSFQGGILVGKVLGKRLKLEGGISYTTAVNVTSTRFITKDSTIVGFSVAPDNFAELLPVLLTTEGTFQKKTIIRTTEHEVRYEYRYLNFPVRVQLFRESRKWQKFVSLGVMASRLLESSISSDHPTQQALFLTKTTDEFFRSWQWSIIGSGGVGYSLSDHLLLQGSADMATALAPITYTKMIEGVKQKPSYQLGISVGITYRFRNR
jgi:hypothetical protein